MKRKTFAGSTSVTLSIFVQNTSSSTGAGLAGLVPSTSGLVAEYRRQGQSTWTAITLATGTLGTWSSGGWIADGSLAGAYELGVPDAAVASGARWVSVRLYGATNMLPVLCEVELDAVNYQDGVRFGLTALPNVAANAVGGLGVLDANSLLDVDVKRWLATAPNALVSGRVDASAGAVADKTGYTASTVTDKTGYALTSGEHTAIGTDVQTGLTAQGYTATRAGFLDALNGILANIWSYATRTLSAFAFTPNVGNVTGTIPNATVGGYATGQDPATLVLATPANKIATDASGNVAANNLPTDYAQRAVAPSWYTAPDNADVVTALADLVTLVGRTDPATAIAAVQTTVNAIQTAINNDDAKALQLTPTAGTRGEAFAFMRSLAGGRNLYGPPSSIPGSGSTTLYAHDGTTVLKTQTTQVDASENIIERV